MKATFIGRKHVVGTKKETGKSFDFFTACLTTEMSEKSLKNGSSGKDVHTPSIPERYADLFCEKNIGKDMDVEFFYSNGKEIIVFAQIV